MIVIKTMRRKIADKKWLTKRLDKLLQESKYWHNFETFDCSVFFKGEELASHNYKLYKKGSTRVSRQIKFVQSRLTEINNI